MQRLYQRLFWLLVMSIAGLNLGFLAQVSAAAKPAKSRPITTDLEQPKTTNQSSVITLYPGAEPITLKAQQVLIIDFMTGQILLAKNADQKFAPSSMTKIMTSYLIEEKIKQGLTSLDAQFMVSRKAWQMKGTKSFMPLGCMVSLEDILRGIIVQSGNDASIVAAEGLCGSETAFVDEMNQQAKKFAMHSTSFANASGWPDQNHYSNAEDLARLGTFLINDHPEFYPLYSEKSFTFNQDCRNQPINQGNRNPLLYKNVGCDGIKTGFTSEGGYGAVLSFIADQRRYLMVINGLNSMQARSNEALKLLFWVKHNFVNHQLYSQGQLIKQADVQLGVKNQVSLVVKDDVFILAGRQKRHLPKITIQIQSPLQAPLTAGQVAGKIIIINDHNTQEVPLIMQESIGKISILQQLSRYFASFFTSLK